MKDKPNLEIIRLMPILASLLFGVFCAVLISASSMETYEITPFSEGAGSIGNALYFVILVGLGASILYLLLRKRNHRLINLIIGFALTTAVFLLSIIYLSATFSIFVVPHAEFLILTLSIFITAMVDLIIFRTNSKLCNLIILCLGGGLGAFLGFTVPTLSAFLILIFLAVYDAIAVYHGPVGKIAHSGLEQLRGLSFSFKDIQMGLGDLTFYSMLSGHMLLYFGFLPCLASLIGILAGCLLAFKMLEKRGMFPGLPFPILFGLTAGFLVSLLRF
ncbi:MAG: presenilin family intramembrane aspartyl protease [Candidatus Bathyarchaeota archaeon]|nr:presenilin family intramembrane aspartyl protease [Candidatus Bathyarchaeota archaeon]